MSAEIKRTYTVVAFSQTFILSGLTIQPDFIKVWKLCLTLYVSKLVTKVFGVYKIKKLRIEIQDTQKLLN